MTETQEEVQYADYYQCAAGLTVGVHVYDEGEVVQGSAMGFTKDNPPLSEEEQEEKYGQVMYKEYDPEEGEDLSAVHKASRTIRAMMGMQTPDMPPVDPIPLSEQPLDTLSRQELRTKAKNLGLNFPEDTDRDQMLGAIDKKLKEGGEKRENEPEIVAQRRENAKEAIEKNNELATGGAGGGGGGGAARRPRSSHAEPPAEEEER